MAHHCILRFAFPGAPLSVLPLPLRKPGMSRPFPSRARGASSFQYLIILLASALAALLLAEAYLSRQAASRLTLPFYNELYPYVMFRPHADYTYETPDTHLMSRNTERVQHYTNADGFRVPSPGYDLPRSKPAGQLRIAFLGSSAVQLGSTYETTLPGALRMLLRERYPGRDIEVINAGIQSCVSRQSIMQLVFTVVAYQPDIVILYDGVNDIGLPLTYESRANFPYNFQTMQEAWDTYRHEYQQSLWQLLLNRSRVYATLRAQFGDAGETTTANTVVLGLNKAPNAVTADYVTYTPEFAEQHIAAYLSNWRQLIELSQAFNYTPVCILQPTGGLERDYALPLTMRDFGLEEETANEWIDAFEVLYKEADKQIENLKSEQPSRAVLNLRSYLTPAEDHFWDLVHVYDETNRKLAERIYQDIQPTVETALKH